MIDVAEERLDSAQTGTDSDLVGTLITERPLGGRKRSPAPGSHRTQHADFPQGRQTLIHRVAIACCSL